MCEKNIKNLFSMILIIPDFDDDGTLDYGDLEKLVNCLTGESADTRLTSEEMSQLISNVNMLAFSLSPTFIITVRPFIPLLLSET